MSNRCVKTWTGGKSCDTLCDPCFHVYKKDEEILSLKSQINRQRFCECGHGGYWQMGDGKKYCNNDLCRLQINSELLTTPSGKKQ